MFGFGRSKNEKAVISLFTAQFESLGIPREGATESATKMVDQVLADLRPSGGDPYKTTQGDEYVLQEPFVSPRLSAGLKVEDIRFHWNRPLVVVFCEMKMREMFNSWWSTWLVSKGGMSQQQVVAIRRRFLAMATLRSGTQMKNSTLTFGKSMRTSIQNSPVGLTLGKNEHLRLRLPA